MWRKIVLLTLLSFWICGCLAMFTAQKPSPASSPPPQRDRSEVRDEEVPTPRLFNFDLSIP